MVETALTALARALCGELEREFLPLSSAPRPAAGRRALAAIYMCRLGCARSAPAGGQLQGFLRGLGFK